MRRLVQQPLQHLLLAAAEIRLAVQRKDVGNRQARRLLDLGVAVIKWPAQLFRQTPPDGGLSRPGPELPTIILGNAEGGRYRYARRAGEAQSYLIDRNPDVPRAAAQWVESLIVDIRGDRVREVTITHADGEVVRLSKDSSELANFDVADVPEGRELSYPGVANVVGNALRELNLEDVEPATAPPAEDATTVEYRTFDGLVVRVTGTERDDESWITLEASADTAAETPAPPAADGAAPADPAVEAAAINAKVDGWRYKIASYQYDQMTRRIADLLKAPPAA
jgi:hypothetical protein